MKNCENVVSCNCFLSTKRTAITKNRLPDSIAVIQHAKVKKQTASKLILATHTGKAEQSHLQEAGSTFAHNIPRVTKTVAHINFSISMQLKCQKILKFHKNTKFVI